MSFIFKNPVEYSKNSNPQYIHAHKMFDKKTFKEDSIILDIGCGTGEITRDIALMVPIGKVVGTDISTQMINHATKQYAPGKNNNLSYEVMPAEKNFFCNQFDWVVSFFCLHWVKKQTEALLGMYNALLDDGKVLLLIPTRHKELYNAIDYVCAQPKWSSVFQNFINPHCFYYKIQYEKFLKHSNFNIHLLSEEIINYSFTSYDEFFYFLAAWLPHLKLLSEENGEKFLHDIIIQYTKYIPFTQGCLNLPLSVIKIFASKN